MTNEEKADEISEKYGVSKLIPTKEECIAYDAAMEMAEWKEKEMLDCAVAAYCECCDTKECEEGYCDMGGECNWKLKFEKKLLKNLKK